LPETKGKNNGDKQQQKRRKAAIKTVAALGFGASGQPIRMVF